MKKYAACVVLTIIALGGLNTLVQSRGGEASLPPSEQTAMFCCNPVLPPPPPCPPECGDPNKPPEK